ALLPTGARTRESPERSERGYSRSAVIDIGGCKGRAEGRAPEGPVFSRFRSGPLYMTPYLSYMHDIHPHMVVDWWTRIGRRRMLEGCDGDHDHERERPMAGIVNETRP